MKMVQEGLHVGIAIEIDIGVRVPIARQKFFDAQRIRRMTRAHHRDIPKTLGKQFCSPKDKRAHQDFTEFCVGLDQSQHVLAADFDDITGLAGSYAVECPTARKRVHLASELSWRHSRDECFASTGRTYCFQFTGDDDENRYVPITLLDEDLSDRNGP